MLRSLPHQRIVPQKRQSTRVHRIIFVTGTDTGVGKTLLTCLLLAHLRNSGDRALAIKPFCSGDRADALTLCSLQHAELKMEEVNPWFFPEPLAPAVAARRGAKSPSLGTVLKHIRNAAEQCDTLLVEG